MIISELMKTVRDQLQITPPWGIKETEIDVLPEGKAPGWMGERFVSIHALTLEGTTPRLSIRKRRILFGISVIQRARVTPNDRFGHMYIDYESQASMTTLMEDIISIIEDEDFTQTFKTAIDTIPIPPSAVDGGYDPQNPPQGLPSRYQISDGFIFYSMNLDPEHLYPSDFLTRAGNDKEQLYDKVAGFKMTARFGSPEYQDLYPAYQCRPLYTTEEESDSSSP